MKNTALPPLSHGVQGTLFQPQLRAQSRPLPKAIVALNCNTPRRSCTTMQLVLAPTASHKEENSVPTWPRSEPRPPERPHENYRKKLNYRNIVVVTHHSFVERTPAQENTKLLLRNKKTREGKKESTGMLHRNTAIRWRKTRRKRKLVQCWARPWSGSAILVSHALVISRSHLRCCQAMRPWWC